VPKTSDSRLGFGSWTHIENVIPILGFKSYHFKYLSNPVSSYDITWYSVSCSPLQPAPCPRVVVELLHRIQTHAQELYCLNLSNAFDLRTLRLGLGSIDKNRHAQLCEALVYAAICDTAPESHPDGMVIASYTLFLG
jgi:hypothetical protein